MNIRDEEQLQQYFERQMTGSQEQNFLINVAARDDMRMAFRSQLELLKAVREDKDASGSPTFIRTKTLGALGLGGALVPSSLKEQETAQAAAMVSSSVWETIGNAFRRPMISITTGLLAGALGTFFLVPTSIIDTHEQGATPKVILQAPTSAPIQTPVITPITTAPPLDQEKRSNSVHSALKKETISEQATSSDQIPVVNAKKNATVELKKSFRKPGDPEPK